MIRIYFIVLLILISLESCKSQNINTLILEAKKNYYLPFDKNEFIINNYPISPFIHKGELYFCLPNQNTIYQFNLDSQKYKKIVLEDKIFHFNGYYPMNDSEIVISKTYSYLYQDQHDSSLVVIDYNGKTKKYLNILELPIYHSNKNLSKPYYISNKNLSHQFAYHQKELILSNYSMNAYFGDTIFHLDSPPLFFIYNLANQKYKIPDFEYPVKMGEFFSKEHSIHYEAFGEDGHIVISFSHTPWILKYSSKKNKIIKRSYAKSFWVDTIKPLSTYEPPKYRKDKDPYQAKYSYLFYHENLKRYFRFVRLAPPINPTPKQLNQPIYSMQELDLNLNILSETILEYPEFAFFSVPYQKGILAFNSNATQDTSEFLVFTYYEFNSEIKDNAIIKDWLNKKQNDSTITTGIVSYLKAIIQKPLQAGNYFIIPILSACPSCVEGLIEYFCKHEKKWCTSDLKIILVGNENLIKNKVPYPNCIDCFNLDYKNLIWDYVEKFTNFRLITIDENEQIIDDRILNPNDLPLIEKLLNSLQTK